MVVVTCRQTKLHAIAFALTDRGPDHNQIIQEAFRNGELKTKKDATQLVRKLLNEQLLTGHWNRKDLPGSCGSLTVLWIPSGGNGFKDNDRTRGKD